LRLPHHGKRNSQSPGIASLAQVKLKIAHRKKTSEGDVTTSKDLIFLLDELPAAEPPKKKSKKTNKDGESVNLKNFGAFINIAKFKRNENLGLAWRCRLESQQEMVSLMPIRPVAILQGMVEVESQNFCLM